MASTPSPLPRLTKKLRYAHEDLLEQQGKLRNPDLAKAFTKILDADSAGWMQHLRKVCFRGDTREPAEIFRDGFLNRETQRDFRKSLDVIRQGTSELLRNERTANLLYNPNPRYRNALHYFLDADAAKIIPAYDNDPDTGVSLTRRVGMSPLFPLNASVKKLWIYAVWVEHGYMTYHRQISDGALGLAAAKEVTVRYLPSRHVIAAVECERTYDKSAAGTTVAYVMKAPIVENPNFVNPGAVDIMRAKFAPYLNQQHRLRWSRDNVISLERFGPEEAVTGLYTAPQNRDHIRFVPSAHRDMFGLGIDLGYVASQHAYAAGKYQAALEAYNKAAPDPVTGAEQLPPAV